jgi:hypothetical protein
MMSTQTPRPVCADGTTIFSHAMSHGIGIPNAEIAYRSGRCREWIKIKNPTHPAMGAVLVALSKRPAHQRALNRWRTSTPFSDSELLVSNTAAGP